MASEPAKQPRIKITLCLDPKKAVRALEQAYDLIGSVQEDMPWRDELRLAMRRLQFVADHLTVEKVEAE